MQKRIDAINSYIQTRDEVKISELEKKFSNVSAMTLRRDLDQLEKRGEVIRTRGGARSIRSLSKRMIREDIYSRRMQDNLEGKKIIAGKASLLIEENESIYIDSGTTAMCLAESIPDVTLAVLTSAPSAALELTRCKNVDVILTGGRLSRDNYSVSGMVSVDFINNTNIDTAFLSASGFSPETGFTTGSLNQCELKKAVISKARRVVMMMDKRKIDVHHMFTFANLNNIDVLVTDEPLPEHILRLVKENNIKII